MSVTTRFGRNLTKQRKKAGITQEELGMRAGLHPAVISELEFGERAPRVSTVVKLVTALDIRSDLLLIDVADEGDEQSVAES